MKAPAAGEWRPGRLETDGARPVRYALRRLRTLAATPARPVPKSTIVIGSGTGLVGVTFSPTEVQS